MATVKAKSIPKPETLDDIDRAYFTLCYYYPQYTWTDAKKMPFHILLWHLKIARQEKAAEYMELLNISAAPHSKKGQGVGKLGRQYEKAVNG